MKLVFLFILVLTFGCDSPQTDMKNIDIQGHRGCRGIYPENTIPAFLHAIDLGVTTLELDLVITADSQVLISHEPFFNHEIATGPDGDDITKETELEHNVFKMPYQQVMKYDVGLKAHSRFPQQKKMAVHKPLLRDMVVQAEQYAQEKGRTPLRYNMEIKRKKGYDGQFHPDYQTFAKLVCEEVVNLGVQNRTTIQCFDVETLQWVHKNYPDFELVYLIENQNSLEANLKVLGFVPEVYSPYYEFVNDGLVAACKQKGMLLIPWTVNEKKDMERLLSLGVDGIISDYPDVLMKVVEIKE